MPTIAYDDLEAALEWVSGSEAFGNAAYISKATGHVYYASSGVDVPEELPDDCDDPALYWSVPDTRALDLGSRLVHQFAEQHLPEHQHEVRDIFRRKGAYGRFKALLERLGALDAWHEFERSETASALLAWAQEEGMSVELRRRDSGA